MPTSSPTSMVPGEIIELSDKNKKKLGGFVSDLIDDLERQYSTYLKTDIPVWWKWKNAVPLVAEKTFPWRGASNLVVPYIRTMADATSATMFGKVFAASPRIWKISTENEDPERQKWALAWDRHLNWAANGNDFNFKLPIYDWLDEIATIGSSVMAINYRTDVRNVFFGAGSNNRKKLNSQTIEWSKGPVFEHAPRENYLWDTTYRIGDAPVVVREHAYTQVQLEIMAQADTAWDQEEIEKIKGATGNDGSPAAPNRQARNREDSRSDASHNTMRPHDVREVHIDVPLAKASGIEIPGTPDSSPNAPYIPLVIHIHRNTRKILRITAEPYHLPHKPFFDGFYRKTGSRGMSIGLAKLLMPFQEFISTTFNQAADSATRMNALWAKTRNKQLSMKPFDPSKPIFVSDMGEIEPFQVSTQFVNNLPLINAANVFGERVTGVNDPLLGRETRHGGHSAPATSTLALLGQQDKMTIGTDELMRDCISRMGLAATILYQQFETNEDGRLRSIHGEEDAEALENIIFPQEPIPTNYMFDVAAMSPNSNPDAEQRKAVVTNQMVTSYWAFVLRVVQTVEANPNIGPVAQEMAIQSIKSMTHSFKKFLEASNEDDIERFIAQLNESGGANDPNQFDAIAGAAGEIAGGLGNVQAAGPVGGSGAGTQAGAIVAPAGGGVLIE